MTQQRTIKRSYDGNATIRAILTEAKRGKPIALEIIRSSVENTKTALRKKQRAGDTSAGITNFLTGERLPWSWERVSQTRALDQCLFFATLAYAQIARSAAPDNDVPLSQSGLLIDPDVLCDLMQFVATDTQLAFPAPFPYTQNEMRRAFEERMAHTEGE